MVLEAALAPAMRARESANTTTRVHDHARPLGRAAAHEQRDEIIRVLVEITIQAGRMDLVGLIVP